MECTVNRVGDVYFDQMERSGHAARADDIDRLAALGLRTLRYPILWERLAPDRGSVLRWSWADERLHRLRGHGLRAIVGLLHHGSGPRYTSLLDPELPHKLAALARAVAERYPWIDAYTPINEPLTTARFSGLYGHWYPHRRDPRSFVTALLLQCRAIARSMRAIREVSPGAALVQTEDLGQTRSTPALAYQAAFENERRWLTYDLLCGRVDRQHPLWGYLLWAGANEADLEDLQENACPPDVIGINHYVTSERFLDERLDRYPPVTHGGNGRDCYADVEAVRVCADGLVGARSLLNQAWARYRRPVAMTEVHIGCSPEEQIRWLLSSWDAARAAREDGASVIAVTSWALFGSYDWCSLVTRPDGHYEPGAFDVQDGAPRPTVVADVIRELSRGARPSHPALEHLGWWSRDARLLYPAVSPHGEAT